MINVGIFGDKYFASTGMANILNHLATEVCKDDDLKVYFFGRFGIQDLEYKPIDGFTPQPILTPTPFFYVPCQGGVWDRELCVRIIKHYNLDVCFSEDDWFSINGLAGACEFWNKPFHFLTPIDGLPLHINSNKVFKNCNTVYVPNASWQIIKERGFNSIYLPHGVDDKAFQHIPLRKENEKFRFLWIGRDDPRKALGRTILAYEKMLSMSANHNVEMIIHTDWNTPNAQKTKQYIEMKHLPVIGSQMSNNPHEEMVKVYNCANANIVSAKAGGCEMSILEAAACQVPTLVTDWNFMNEFVIDQKTGFRIPYENLITEPEYGRMWANINIGKLADTMLLCLDNPKPLNEMGIQARLHIQKNYSWVETGKELTKRIKESVISTTKN